MVVALEYTGYLVKLRQDVHPLSRLLGGLIQTRLHQELQSKWTPETTNSVTATPKNGELGRLTVVKRITRNRSNSEAHEPSPTRPSAGDPPPRGGAAITAWLCRTASGDPSRPPWGGPGARRSTRNRPPRDAATPGPARTGRTGSRCRGTARLLTGLSSARSLSLCPIRRPHDALILGQWDASAAPSRTTALG
jgi:hypothetical protein